MAEMTMAHPDYVAARPEIRYDGPIGPELWKTLRQRMGASPGHVGLAVLPDGLRLYAYYRLCDQDGNGVGLTVVIYRRGFTADEAWAAYVAAIWSILPAGDWWRKDGLIGPGYRMTTLKCTGSTPAKEAA